MQKLLTFFSKKFQVICISLNVNFNELLTNNNVSFEQLGPGLEAKYFGASDLGLHCLLTPVCPNIWGYNSNYKRDSTLYLLGHALLQ